MSCGPVQENLSKWTVLGILLSDLRLQTNFQNELGLLFN